MDDLLKAELGDDKIQVAQAGPAGEKLVRLAAIMNMANRANGRTGMGAVMGSKNLKAIVVRGTSRKVPMADAAALGKLAKWGSNEIPNNGDVLDLRINGTEGVLEGQHAAGGLPTFNYNAGQFEHYEEIGGATMTATILKNRETCYSCAVRCKRAVETEWEGRPVERAPRRPGVRDGGHVRLVLRHRRSPRDLARQPDLQRERPGHDRHRGHDRLDDGLLHRRGPGHRGGDRLPGPVRGRRRP